MTKLLKLFCTSHKNVNYLNEFKDNINLVGCGPANFDNNWINSNTRINIQQKFNNYADLVGQYWVWKNYIKDHLNENIWVGISQYRRHWLNSTFEEKNKYDLKSLNKIILIESKKEWSKFDSVLTTPFIFKEKFFEKIKSFNFFKDKVTIKNQMFQSLGKILEYTYDEMLKKLPDSLGTEFDYYISNSNILSAHGMYISSPKILDTYMELIFNWFEECENIIEPESNIKLSNIPRFFQYFNERFSDFWFRKYTNFTTNPIGMYKINSNQITLIGKTI